MTISRPRAAERPGNRGRPFMNRRLSSGSTPATGGFRGVERPLRPYRHVAGPGPKGPHTRASPVPTGLTRFAAATLSSLATGVVLVFSRFPEKYPVCSAMGKSTLLGTNEVSQADPDVAPSDEGNGLSDRQPQPLLFEVVARRDIIQWVRRYPADCRQQDRFFRSQPRIGHRAPGLADQRLRRQGLPAGACRQSSRSRIIPETGTQFIDLKLRTAGESWHARMGCPCKWD